MFVGSVCTVTINAEAIENGDSHRREKVSVGSPTNLCLTEFKVEGFCDAASQLIELYDAFSSLQWRPVDAARDCYPYTLVKRRANKQGFTNLSPLCSR